MPVLAGCRLPGLTALSVRHADTGDLQFLAGFATLENLMVWQCPKLTRFDGLERLTRLRALALNDLGAIEFLVPLAALTQLEALGKDGGRRVDDPGAAVAAAAAGADEARAAQPGGGQGDRRLGDLGPLCDLRHLSQLQLSPRIFFEWRRSPAWRRRIRSGGASC